jgi:hypothetical protein
VTVGTYTRENTVDSNEEAGPVDTLDPQESRNQTPDPTGTSMPAHAFDAWRFRDDVDLHGVDLTGYKVEAADGHIGKVDEASQEVNAASMVVDTGPWIFGKKVLIPAGTVNHVDHEERKVYVDRTKEQIKSAPEYDPDEYAEPGYRDKVGDYYGDTYYSPGGPGPIPPLR